MSEAEYMDWLKSIEFVDEDGQVLPTELKPDKSDDPDGDRELEEVAGQ